MYLLLSLVLARQDLADIWIAEFCHQYFYLGSANEMI